MHGTGSAGWSSFNLAILTPVIVVVCAVGAYAVHSSMIDIWYMLLFGVIGYVFEKLDDPLAPWWRRLRDCPAGAPAPRET